MLLKVIQPNLSDEIKELTSNLNSNIDNNKELKEKVVECNLNKAISEDKVVDEEVSSTTGFIRQFHHTASQNREGEF